MQTKDLDRIRTQEARSDDDAQPEAALRAEEGPVEDLAALDAVEPSIEELNELAQQSAQSGRSTTVSSEGVAERRTPVETVDARELVAASQAYGRGITAMRAAMLQAANNRVN